MAKFVDPNVKRQMQQLQQAYVVHHQGHRKRSRVSPSVDCPVIEGKPIPTLPGSQL
jgi:hypothetical protein